MGSIPAWSGRVPHASEQLSPYVTTIGGLIYGQVSGISCGYFKNLSLLCLWSSEFNMYQRDLPYNMLLQFSSVTQSCLTLCNPMDCSMPAFPVYCRLPEFTQTHVHQVGDDIQPSHLLLSPFTHTFNLSQHQGLLQWVSSSHQVAKVLELQLQHWSFQWTLRTDFL